MREQLASPSSDHRVIAGSGMWQSLSPEIIDLMLNEGQQIALAPGEHLFQAGDAFSDCIHLHLEGELEQTSASGDVRHAEPGDLIGLANYLDGHDYRSTALALSDCRLLALASSTVRRLEQQSPEFFEAINRALASRMRKALQVRETVRGTLSRPVRHFMQSGLPTCSPETTIADAGRILQQRQIGLLGITDDNDRLQGLLTPISLLNDLVERRLSPDDPVNLCEAGTGHRVLPDTPLWQVEELQRRHLARDVVVVDEQDAPVGLISQTDLIQALAKPPFTLEGEIKAAQDIETLAVLRRRIPAAARRVHEAHRSAGAAVRALTDMHLALQYRLIELLLAEMREDGYGRPPARYAVVIMGSGGRGEMLLRPDQDNGLIIEDGVDAAGLEWFREFAERLNPGLDHVGYRLCPGNVMARNPDYRRTLGGWQEKLSQLVREPGKKEARLANIVLDFATLYGDDTLTARLREHLNTQLRDEQGRMLFRLMVSDNAKIVQPLGVFNRLVPTTHQGSKVIDLKRTGLRIIVDAMRVFALREGVSRCKTLERIAALRRLGVFEPDFSETMRIAFEELQDLLLTHQLEQVRRGETPDPLLRMERLSSHERERLRVSLRASRRMREHLQTTFGVVMN